MPNVPTRDPGSAIKAALRREVNFGCPVRHPDGNGCGSPVLTWHHFDPPWSEGFNHEAGGMIALCKTHHDQADGGLWTKAQLRDFKSNPYVDDRLKVRWPWQTEKMLIKVGPSIVLGEGSALRLDGKPVVKFQPTEIPGLNIKTVLPTAQIHDAKGMQWVNITDGWLDIDLALTTDAHFSAQTKTFLAKHADTTYIGMKFRLMKLSEFRKWIPSFWSDKQSLNGVLQSIESAGNVDSDGNVPVVEFEGRFTTDKVSINVSGNKMRLESLIPNMRNGINFSSHLVDDQHRMALRMSNDEEFFSLG